MEEQRKAKGSLLFKQTIVSKDKFLHLSQHLLLCIGLFIIKINILNFWDFFSFEIFQLFVDFNSSHAVQVGWINFNKEYKQKTNEWIKSWKTILLGSEKALFGENKYVQATGSKIRWGNTVNWTN